MSFRTLEVEIDHGQVLPKGPERLPDRGIGLLTIFDQAQPIQNQGKRIEAPLVRCRPGTLIDPTPADLDASLWD